MGRNWTLSVVLFCVEWFEPNKGSHKTRTVCVVPADFTPVALGKNLNLDEDN